MGAAAQFAAFGAAHRPSHPVTHARWPGARPGCGHRRQLRLYALAMTDARDHEETLGPERLTTTAYAVLAVLSVNQEELSAPEINARANYGMRRFYWSPAVSHIRRELRRLLSCGFVGEREITIGRIRRSRIYQTTDAGERALAAWVVQPGIDDTIMVKNPVLLRVFLGAKAPPAFTVSLLEGRIKGVEEDIEQIVWGRRRSTELGISYGENLRYARAVGEYTLRGLYADLANLRHLRDDILDFDTEAFSSDDRHQRTEIRRRRDADEG